MALLGSRKEYSKKDINFFEEFTASARKQAQVLAAVVFIGVIAIGLCLAVLAFNLVRNAGVSGEIRNLQATLDSEEYVGLELKAQNLQAEVNSKNLYYYTLTQMRRIVDEVPVAETSLVNLVADCIPSTAYVSQYEVTGDILSVGGCTFSYYDAATICNMLNDSDVFASVPVLRIERDNSMASVSIEDISYIDVYYDFAIQGNLDRDILISIGYYANTDTGVIALGGVETTPMTNGSTYEYTEIANRVVNGTNYILSSVSINGIAQSPETLSVIINNDRISGLATENTEIALYYAVGEAVVEEDGGEA